MKQNNARIFKTGTKNNLGLKLSSPEATGFGKSINTDAIKTKKKEVNSVLIITSKIYKMGIFHFEIIDNKIMRKIKADKKVTRTENNDKYLNILGKLVKGSSSSENA